MNCSRRWPCNRIMTMRDGCLARSWPNRGGSTKPWLEFRKAIDLRPGYWGHYNDFGLALYAAARYDDAMQAFRQVIALQPDNYMGYQQLGTVHHMVGRLDEAVRYYEQSVAIRPNAAVLNNMGAIYHARGEYRPSRCRLPPRRSSSARTHRWPIGTWGTPTSEWGNLAMPLTPTVRQSASLRTK